MNLLPYSHWWQVGGKSRPIKLHSQSGLINYIEFREAAPGGHCSLLWPRHSQSGSETFIFKWTSLQWLLDMFPFCRKQCKLLFFLSNCWDPRKKSHTYYGERFGYIGYWVGSLNSLCTAMGLHFWEWKANRLLSFMNQLLRHTEQRHSMLRSSGWTGDNKSPHYFVFFILAGVSRRVYNLVTRLQVYCVGVWRVNWLIL